MRQFKKIFWISLVLFCSLSSRSKAQNTTVISPDKVAISAIEIVDLFGGMISVDTTQIKNFYLNHWMANPFDDSSPYPDVEVTDISNTSVTFDWDYLSSPATNDFRVSYLNLSTGNYGSTNTTNNTITLMPPNDLYLFAFQTESLENQSSALTIIIIEKPVSLISSSDPCNCPGRTLDWSGDFSNAPDNNSNDDYNSNRLVYKNWSEITPANKYYVKVTTADGLFSQFTFAPQFDDQGTPNTIFLYSSICMTNIDLNDPETLLCMLNPLEQNDGVPHLGLFGFANEFLSSGGPTFSFNYSQPVEKAYNYGTVFLYTCGLPQAEVLENNDEQIFEKLSLKSRSNPFRQSTSIRYTLPKDEAISIALYDHQGRVVKQFKHQEWTIAGDYNMDLQLNDLPKGMYFCLLKTKKETLSLKLVKTE